ncbi:MAG: hypothetical protein R6W76_09975 [Caldilinea sp.]
MKNLAVLLGTIGLAFTAVCSSAPTATWDKFVPPNSFGVGYVHTTDDDAKCFVEYHQTDEATSVLKLYAGTPAEETPIFISYLTISDMEISDGVGVVSFFTKRIQVFGERQLDGSVHITEKKEVAPTEENDVFGNRCVDVLKNGVIVGSDGTTTPFPAHVLKAFRGQYGIGE